MFTNTAAALTDATWAAQRCASAAQQAQAIEREGRAALERFCVYLRHARRLPQAIHVTLVADAHLHHPRGYRPHPAPHHPLGCAFKQ
ncbi:MAG: hypothetical protein KatS3mg131_2368 [Candidatus Tectimicrobiota bacterium]|nr:MAG: hypothetical protein KatS3mg131_2368 [Candidatus Tectomicrobia bacterium]